MILIANLFGVLLAFFTPVVSALVALGIIIAFILGALADPSGWLNQSINFVIDMIVNVLPSTPDNLKIGFLIDSISSKLPLLGRGIISSLFANISIIFGLRAAIAIYKLIPFKAT